MTKKKVIKKTVKKTVKTTHDEFIESMTPEQKKKHAEGYRDLLLSELLIAIMKDDAVSVRALAKAAGISPALVQGVRSGEKQNITTQSFFKILQALGCSIVVKKNKHSYPLELMQ
jgi:DNA-binding Xre family transcriptional regulator